MNMAKVKPIPDGYNVVTPVLVVKDAARAIDFYKSAFGAKERMRMAGPGGAVVHAELTIGDQMIMLGPESPQSGDKDPQALGGSPVRIHLYVSDVDSTVKQATSAGAKVVVPVSNQFYGDRSGRIQDPFGHLWIVSSHVEDVAPEEMERRMKEFMSKAAGG
jgi:PhnB protein